MSEVDSPPAAIPLFGEELRKEREMRGISLKEIADATKISKRFLEAIERNDHRTLPAPVFTRGFVREYARYLGLNADEMVTRYGDYVRATEQPDELLAPVTPVRSGGVIMIVLAGAVVLLLLGAVVGFFLRNHKSSAPVETKHDGGTAAAVMPVQTAAVTQSSAVDGMKMHITFREKTWLNALADGRSVLNGEIDAGSSKEIEAKQEIVFRTLGNAGGVSVELNGRNLAPLGGSGEVKHNLRFTPGSTEPTQSRP